jgi:hypothetical protein
MGVGSSAKSFELWTIEPRRHAIPGHIVRVRPQVGLDQQRPGRALERSAPELSCLYE